MDQYNWERSAAGNVVIIDEKAVRCFEMLKFDDEEHAKRFLRELNDRLHGR